MNSTNYQSNNLFEKNMLMSDLEFPKPGQSLRKGSSAKIDESPSKDKVVSLIECKKLLESPQADNQEKIKKLMDCPKMMNTIQNIILNGKAVPSEAVLRLEVKNQAYNGRRVDLISSDIEKIFGKYGSVRRVDIVGSRAKIWFESLISALIAQKALDNYRISELALLFKVELLSEEEINEPLKESPSNNHIYKSHRKGSCNFNHSTNQTSVMFLKNNQKLIKIQANSVSSSKLTCRYDIQIQNDKEFQVAKKIIGAKGCNMKHIIDMTLSNTIYDRRTENDLIKLRLRGKGSGFKEGPAKKESDEPLHLCVSAKYYELYVKACVLVEDLLTKIYSEYKNYCKEMGVSFDPEMAIKKIECFNPKSSDNPDPLLLKGRIDQTNGMR